MEREEEAGELKEKSSQWQLVGSNEERVSQPILAVVKKNHKQQKCIYDSSGDWEIHDQGTIRFDIW